ncbi:BZ3500_MvSof-1268-A1-R1_Chr10-1g02586 [Microbotryum saponariae]|uniref:BZ3500_MvSof-1268-A1-R1_Chr10-1g02586 protein n=1 Tax=Microbotryum saponariae TaxID=289078 RepID=A0A2X0N2R4_9BASI|nr:BZ3500_MvSof-1268-A1-R1_Chr10-1g02586 [Microbotryum saponariae]SDA06075.1 BZ3501_MvSof-1269-A2-R1_Chr10-1g02187 [Microbotryum saponariae]
MGDHTGSSSSSKRHSSSKDDSRSSSYRHHSHHSSHRSSHNSKRDETDPDLDVVSSERHSKRHRASGTTSSSQHRHSGPSSSTKRTKGTSTGTERAHEQPDEEDEWVEAPSSNHAAGAASSLLTIHAPSAKGPPIDTVSEFQIGHIGSVTEGLRSSIGQQQDMTDGYGEGDVGGSNNGGGRFGDLMSKNSGGMGMDLFGMMGTERKRKDRAKERVDPSVSGDRDRRRQDQTEPSCFSTQMMMGQSSRELNKAHWQGIPDPPSAVPTLQSTGGGATSQSPAPGSSGSAWRMSKLKRTFEVAQEEGKDVEEIALDCYGNLDAFRDAIEERRILDEREDRRRGRRSNYGAGGSGPSTPTAEPSSSHANRRFIYTDSGSESIGASRPGSRNSFRRPGEPTAVSSVASSKEGSRPSTPVPSVLAPRPMLAKTARTSSQLSQSIVLVPDPTTTTIDPSPVLSQTELNKLQARVIKARLMDADDATELEIEYERESIRAREAQGPMGHGEQVGDKVEMVPTLDAQGNLYDIGRGDRPELERKANGRKQKEKGFQSHDPKTGEVLRQSAEDDVSLAELVRQERFSGGAADQKRLDNEFASRIATDRPFTNDLDYMDEHADSLARKKMKSDTIKKAFAIQDYAKTKKALDSCTMCFSDSGGPPRSAVVALGTRAYLGLLDNEELVPGHCRIVPIQHHFTSLDADEETWDEIKNFMKTLMQYFAASDRGVVFFETIISLKHQKHCAIEAFPVPFDLFDQLPVYFREAIFSSESEWSQNQKLVTFNPSRPFRRALVPNLPYFMVQFDYKGEKGYGHVIEGVDDATERDKDGDELRDYTGGEKGEEFKRYFAHEIIGNLLGLEARRWRKPRRVDARKNDERVRVFRKGYDAYDWTKMLAQTSEGSAAGGSKGAEEGVARE